MKDTKEAIRRDNVFFVALAIVYVAGILLILLT